MKNCLSVINFICFSVTLEDPDSQETQMYNELFSMWIQNNNRMPSGFLLDTSEEALLLPDWLKLRMLRSSDDRLVSAGRHRPKMILLEYFLSLFWYLSS